MYELLFQKINDSIKLTEAEMEFCKTLFQPKKLRKRQYLLQEGEVCKYSAFVTRGLLRTFAVDDKGKDHILQFSAEGWWVSDLYSFYSGEETVYNIEALENCELLLLSRQNMDILFDEIPAFNRYFRILLQNNLIATQRRLMDNLKESAEEKYLKFTRAYPLCTQRVPQHMIASYLGMTRETLSRTRSQMATRKENWILFYKLKATHGLLFFFELLKIEFDVFLPLNLPMRETRTSAQRFEPFKRNISVGEDTIAVNLTDFPTFLGLKVGVLTHL